MDLTKHCVKFLEFSKNSFAIFFPFSKSLMFPHWPVKCLHFCRKVYKTAARPNLPFAASFSECYYMVLCAVSDYLFCVFTPVFVHVVSSSQIAFFFVLGNAHSSFRHWLREIVLCIAFLLSVLVENILRTFLSPLFSVVYVIQ